MRVVESFDSLEGATRELFVTQLLNKIMVNIVRSHLELFSFGGPRSVIEKNSIFEERQHSWEDLPSKHIAFSENADGLILRVNLEARVGITPAVEVVIVELGTFLVFVVNEFRVLVAVDIDLLLTGEGLRCLGLSVIVYLFKSLHNNK